MLGGTKNLLVMDTLAFLIYKIINFIYLVAFRHYKYMYIYFDNKNGSIIIIIIFSFSAKVGHDLPQMEEVAVPQKGQAMYIHMYINIII